MLRYIIFNVFSDKFLLYFVKFLIGLKIKLFVIIARIKLKYSF